MCILVQPLQPFPGLLVHVSAHLGSPVAGTFTKALRIQCTAACQVAACSTTLSRRCPPACQKDTPEAFAVNADELLDPAVCLCT